MAKVIADKTALIQEDFNKKLENAMKSLNEQFEAKKADFVEKASKFLNESVKKEVVELRNNISHYENCLNSKEGHPILFGIRPEDIITGDDLIKFKDLSDEYIGTVTIAEFLGHEYFIHFDFEGNYITAKIPVTKNLLKLKRLSYARIFFTL